MFDCDRDDACVYVLRSVSPPSRTYVGATINLERRLRQHNGSISGGARRTAGRQWRLLIALHGLRTYRNALRVEFAMKKHLRRCRSDATILRKVEHLMRWQWRGSSPTRRPLVLDARTRDVSFSGTDGACPTMRPQSAKSKGRRLQQRVCRRLVDAFEELTEDDVRSTSMGAGGEDVLLSTRAQECIPFSFEAKCQERLNIWSAVEQAARNCPPSRTPCVVFARNRTDPYVALPFDAFVDLLVRVASAPAGTAVDAGTSLRDKLEQARRLIDSVIGMEDARPNSSCP